MVLAIQKEVGLPVKFIGRAAEWLSASSQEKLFFPNCHSMRTLQVDQGSVFLYHFSLSSGRMGQAVAFA